MSRWAKGENEVAALLRSGDLQQVAGGIANGEHSLARARQIVVSAESLLDSDPDTSYSVAYDAARHTAVALLAHQGLRATSKGGHYALDLALRAQFSPGFRAFSTMRRRRNELEYPRSVPERSDRAEAEQAIADARAMIQAASALLPGLGLW